MQRNEINIKQIKRTIDGKKWKKKIWKENKNKEEKKEIKNKQINKRKCVSEEKNVGNGQLRY